MAEGVVAHRRPAGQWAVAPPGPAVSPAARCGASANGQKLTENALVGASLLACCAAVVQAGVVFPYGGDLGVQGAPSGSRAPGSHSCGTTNPSRRPLVRSRGHSVRCPGCAVARPG